MCLLSHSEHLAHLRWSWCSTTYATHVAILNESVLLSHVLEVGMLQCLSSTKTMIVIINQQFTYQISGIRILGNKF